MGSVLETFVFPELKKRKYELYTGKLGNIEVDFVAKPQKSKLYIQVAESVNGEETLERELKTFSKIRDSYPCAV